MRICGCRFLWAVVIALNTHLVWADLVTQSNILNIVEFGALANDELDDQPAIQAAINHASPGDTVFVPDGLYLISSALELRSGIKLVGQTQSHSIIRYSGPGSDALLRLRNINDVQVSSLTLDGNMHDIANGIFAEKGKGHRLEHLHIKNLVHQGFGPHGILFTGNAQWQDSVTHSVVADNHFSHIGVSSKWGAAVRLANGASFNQLVRNTISDTGRGGILANQGSTDLIIRHNRISGIGKTAEGLSIEVHTECNRAIIEDNIVEHWISLDKTNFSAIRRNLITTDKTDDWKYAALELAGGSNNIFSDNVADGGAKSGISVSTNYPKEYVFWARNTIKHAADWGAQLQGESRGLSYHYFYQNKFLASYRNHPQSSYPDQGHGFRVNGNSHHITLEQNTIEHNQGLGLQFNGRDIDQFSMIANRINNNKLAAVNAYPGQELLWHNNQVTHNLDNSIPLSAGGQYHALPVAEFSSATEVAVHELVQFSNTSHSKGPNGQIAYQLWDFDDGLPSNQPNPEHRYQKPGRYTVSLIVWDEQGRAARHQQIVHVNAIDSIH